MKKGKDFPNKKLKANAVSKTPKGKRGQPPGKTRGMKGKGC